MKVKVINIQSHNPPYEYLSPGEKPEHYWRKTDESWLGFWPQEWPDLLGEAVLKETDQYEWEVWQPDYRADKIYSKTLETGVTHRLFPAEEKSYKLGISHLKGVFSKEIISHLNRLQNNKIILKFHSSYGFHAPFYNEILRIFGLKKRFPIFFVGHGMFKAPISEILDIHRPLTYLCLMVEHFRLKKLLQSVDIISEQAESALNEVKKVYKGRIEKLVLGCDLDFWIPVSSSEAKQSIRRNLNIPQGKTVFLATGNFIPRKQFDKLLETFCSLINRDDFFLIIAGHGKQDYTEMLSFFAEPLVNQGKAILHPYVTGEELRNLYWASDLYVSFSTSEGSSDSIKKAMGCGLPVLSTPVGETSELMRKYKTGGFVPVHNYKEWKKTIEKILDRGLPPPIDINIARGAYHWPNAVKCFIKIYDELVILYRKSYETI